MTISMVICLNALIATLLCSKMPIGMQPGTPSLLTYVVPLCDSDRFGRKSFKVQSTLLWNNITAKFPNENFINISRSKFKNILTKYFIGTYPEIQPNL